MVEGIAFTVNETMGQRRLLGQESIAAYNEALVILEEQKGSLG